MDLRDYGLDHFDDPGLDLSPASLGPWVRRHWARVAEVLGVAQPLASIHAQQPFTTSAAETQLVVSLFASAHARADGDALARVQASAITTMLGRGRARGELWRVSEDATSLPDGACYPANGELRRAFNPDTAPGFFGDGWSGPPPRAESACGWTSPVSLHLGTWPWVYSTRLEGAAPGLSWAPTPARIGLEAMAAFLEPETNLLQDARQVAAACRHFSQQTAPLIKQLPATAPAGTWSEGRPPPRLKVGTLYVHGHELLVHQGSSHVSGLSTSRGRLAVVAYNYCVDRFSAFFAVRSATVRGLRGLPATLQHIALQSPDPILRGTAERVLRG